MRFTSLCTFIVHLVESSLAYDALHHRTYGEPAVGRIGRSTHFIERGGMGNSMYAGSDELVLVGVRCGRSPGGQIELIEDVAQMTGNSLLADSKFIRNRLVG